MEGDEMSTLPPPIVAVHEPVQDSRDRKTRKPLFFFDRVKVTLILVVYFAFAVVLKHADIPIMSWEEAIRDQLDAEWWLVVLPAVETVRRVHYLIGDRPAGNSGWWITTVGGRGNRWWDRRNPWVRRSHQRFHRPHTLLIHHWWD